MKKQIAMMLLASTLLASCEKYETATPSTQSQYSAPTWDNRAFTLDVDFLEVHLRNHGSYVTNPLVENRSQYGYLTRFSTPDGSVEFHFFLDLNGNVLQLWGMYHGKSFIWYEGAINVCGGVQGAPINFNIR